jgi:hypothetical protein
VEESYRPTKKFCTCDTLVFWETCRAEQRLARKEDRALREGPNIACEVELSEIVEEVGVDMMEHGQSADIGYFFRRKGNVCKEVESLFKTSGDQIVAIAGQMTHEKFEGSASVKAILDPAAIVSS